jgi:predicted nucleotidyltransferase
MMDETIRIDVETAARILREAGAAEVYVFGSAAHGTMRPDSDIDFAIRGLPPEQFFRTMGKVRHAISHLFDLVDLDDENPFTDYLVRKGKLIRVA